VALNFKAHIFYNACFDVLVSDGGEVIMWTLDTKYYTANLAVRVTDMDAPPTVGDRGGQDSLLLAERGAASQGVILVFLDDLLPGEDTSSNLAKIEPW
jgi:hypothetical protein